MIFLLLILSYFFGSVNGAIVISKLVYHEDIRTKGSGNPGFTNFKRTYGMNVATLCVVLIDVMKTLLPLIATTIFFDGDATFYCSLVGLGCMLGHAFPCYYGFRGGKTVLAGATAMWFVDWRMGCVVAFVFVFLLLTAKYMSLASLSGALTAPIALAVFQGFHWQVLVCLCASALLIVRHHANIHRLLSGTESRFSLHKK